MPLGGAAFLTHLAERGLGGRFPVVLSSGEQSEGLDAQELLPKPYALDALLDVVRRWAGSP
jgi:hypothetical protein